MNKGFLDKLKLFLIIIGCLFLIIPKDVMAATNPIPWEQKSVKVDAYKVWKITFNQDINVDNLSKKVKVYNPIGLPAPITVENDNNTITVKPPTSGYIPGQTYSLQIYNTIMDLNNNPLKAPIVLSFTIEITDNVPLTDTINKSFIYTEYDRTLVQMVDMQSNVSPRNVVMNYSLTPSKIDISGYVNPKNFEYHDYAVYQFLKLDSYTEGITAEDLNVFLKGKGILENQGEAFLKAAEVNKINVAYLAAHTILETGNGTSVLSKGVLVSEVAGNPVEMKTTYNMFGIGARDANPLKLGSERAYTEGWFTPETAIMGGAKYISIEYINNIARKQNTLYKMRWNPGVPATHQYATDIGWAYKISCKMKEILDKCTNAQLVFEIPQYK